MMSNIPLNYNVFIKQNREISKSDQSPVYIIGAGVIGMSIAVLLLHQGYRVYLIEKNEIAAGAGLASGGMLAPLSEAMIEPVFKKSVYQFSQDNVHFWPEWADFLEYYAKFNIDLRTEGSLYPFLKTQNCQKTINRLDFYQLPYQLLRIDHHPTLRTLFAPEIKKACYLKSDIQIHPNLLMAALKSAFLNLNGNIIQAEVLKIDIQNNHVKRIYLKEKKKNKQEILEIEKLVIATGSGGINLLDPQINLPIYPVKGQTFSLFDPQKRLHHVVRTLNVYIAPKSNGEIICGATSVFNETDNRIDETAISMLYQRAIELIPILETFEIKKKWVGFRPASPDYLPLIGPLDIKGIFIANGHYRAGVTQSPLTAKLVVDWLEERFDSSYWRAFSPVRKFESPILP